MKPNLLFDIDGTLLRIESNFMTRLITGIMDRLSLDLSVLENTRFAGRTDRSIFRALLGKHKENDQLYEQLKGSYISEMQKQLKQKHVSVFDPVMSCLNYFENRNYRIGLLTGNYKEIAAHKLQLGDLGRYFSFGAFGCDHADRNRLGSEAQKSFRQTYRTESLPEDYLIIGDTPLDIQCARHFGCRCVAISTGLYSREELARHEPDLLLNSLENPEQWLGYF